MMVVVYFIRPTSHRRRQISHMVGRPSPPREGPHQIGWVGWLFAFLVIIKATEPSIYPLLRL